MSDQSSSGEARDRESPPLMAAFAGVTRGLTVVTPSYGPDLDLFANLHRSFLEHVDTPIRHVVVVPTRDLQAFSRFNGPRCDVVAVTDVLPRRILSSPIGNYWVNARLPWPPLRGWIVQQLIKLATPDFVNTDAVLLADSDVQFVSRVGTSTFAPNGVVSFLRIPGAVDRQLPRHVTWHSASRHLLGLEPEGSLPLPDHISALTPWDSRIVRSLRDRIEDATGRHWVDSVGRQIHFSEFILYGVFVDEVTRGKHSAATADSRCHSYWDPVPLDSEGIRAFLNQAKDSDVAVMVSAKSGTDLALRRAALAEWNERRV